MLIAVPFAAQAQITEEKAAALAVDFCKCFKPIQDSMSKEAIELLVKVSEAENPDSAMKTAFDTISDDKKMSIAMEFVKLGSIEEEGSEVNTCMNSLQTKYPEYAEDDNALMDMLIKSLKGKQECSLTLAFMKLGMAAKKGKEEE